MHYTIAIDGFNVERKSNDNLKFLALIQIMMKITDVNVIVISSNETLEIDACYYPAITIIRLPLIEKVEVFSISKKIMNPVDRQ